VSNPWPQWTRNRPPTHLLHLDSAAAGRQSLATLEATAAHARLESELGAYVAQERAADVLDQLRSDMAVLLGVTPGGVAFVESATNGLRALLDAWPLPSGAHIGVVPAEWGPNLAAFARRGLQLVELDVDGLGALDVDALQRRLATSALDAVHLTQVTSHRGLVQPVAAAATACHAAGVPIWVDIAQAVGHVDTATGADALYGTSRKWLTGPRGVGVVAVAEASWNRLEVERVPMIDAGAPPLAHVESHEAHVAGRIGLANAVREYLGAGPAAVHERLSAVGRATREAMGELDGWAVVGAVDAPGAITAIRPTAGQDVAATRSRLLADQHIVTTAGAIARAPREMTEPLLRISPHVDCTPEDLGRLVAALRPD
jgi:pyridoxal 5-phosphate dependent beta-lyase